MIRKIAVAACCVAALFADASRAGYAVAGNELHASTENGSRIAKTREGAEDSGQATASETVSLTSLNHEDQTSQEPCDTLDYPLSGKFDRTLEDEIERLQSAGKQAALKLNWIAEMFWQLDDVKQVDIQELCNIAQEMNDLSAQYVHPTGGLLSWIWCCIKNFVTTTRVIRAANRADILMMHLGANQPDPVIRWYFGQ